MKGHFFSYEGKIYKTTTAEAKKILKAVIQREPDTPLGKVPQDSDEVAPVIDLNILTAEEARDAYLEIEMGK